MNNKRSKGTVSQELLLPLGERDFGGSSNFGRTGYAKLSSGQGPPQIVGIKSFSAIPVELKGEFIYDVTFDCDHARRGSPDSRNEMK
ncbi:MAG: hypothetical protein E2O45_02115 [Nitrospina sp.]|nr:hypothetical protein [Nitrospinota bacterium]TDJ51156.1 MAG: hypothetical protein E2O45_02115 [Nitrospina sp.]